MLLATPDAAPLDFTAAPAIAAAVAAHEAAVCPTLKTAAAPLLAEARRHLAAMDGFRVLAAVAAEAGEERDEEDFLLGARAAMSRAGATLRRLNVLMQAADVGARAGRA